MNWDEIMERIAELVTDAAVAIEDIAKEVDKALRTMDALEWERDRWKDPRPTRPSRRTLLRDKLTDILSAHMRAHTAVTGQLMVGRVEPVSTAQVDHSNNGVCIVLTCDT